MPLKCCYGPNLSNPSKGVIGLSIEVVYDLVEHGAAKLQSLKVCSVRDSNPGRPESNDSLVYNLQKRSLEPKRSRIFFDCEL